MAETIIRPGVPASGRVTPASFPFFTTGEDDLRVVSYNSAPGVALKLNARLLDSRGNATPQSWDHTPNTDRSAAITDHPLSGCSLLNLTMFAAAGAPKTGQTFVLVQLVRGRGAAALVLGTILAASVTSTLAIGWPGSPIQTPFDVTPPPRWILGTTPAAGAEISETAPAGARWELIAALAAMITSAAAVNRIAHLDFVHSGRFYAESFHSGALVVGASNRLSWAQGTQVAVDAFGANFMVPIPAGIMLGAGDSFVTTTTNIQAADQWSQPQYLVREWLEI
jgi:hypothetical protein